ncbi:MAG TPA: hypothetical protein VKV28_07415 [Candidatus Binataceae bacterium]|nr:hypothetical protein [Candidatus Binataceae bacterium]
MMMSLLGRLSGFIQARGLVTCGFFDLEWLRFGLTSHKKYYVNLIGDFVAIDSQGAAVLVRLADRKHRVLMTLIVKPHNAFFDESGTHDESDLVVVGGLLATYEAWAAAELEWNRILATKRDKNERSLEVFHYTDFMARQPPWDWPTPERDRFMERLTTVIGEHATLGIAYGVFREDYESELLPSLQAEFRNMYHCCSYFCLEGLVKWSRTFTGPALPRPIEFLFDRQKRLRRLRRGHLLQDCQRDRQRRRSWRNGLRR